MTATEASLSDFNQRLHPLVRLHVKAAVLRASMEDYEEELRATLRDPSWLSAHMRSTDERHRDTDTDE